MLFFEARNNKYCSYARKCPYFLETHIEVCREKFMVTDGGLV